MKRALIVLLLVPLLAVGGYAWIGSGGSGNSAKGAGSYSLGIREDNTSDLTITYGIENQCSGASGGSAIIGIGDTINQVASAVVVGSCNKATYGSNCLDNLIAIGYGNTGVNGARAIQIGTMNNQVGDAGINIGTENSASGNYGIGIGYLNISGGTSAIMIGQQHNASDYGVAIGYGDTTSETQSIAIGYRSKAHKYSTSIGWQCAASNEWSTAYGWADTASGICSNAWGIGAIATQNGTTVINADGYNHNYRTEKEYAFVVHAGSGGYWFDSSAVHIDTLRVEKVMILSSFAKGQRPDNPALGMMITIDGDSDTDSLLVYLGSAWSVIKP